MKSATAFLQLTKQKSELVKVVGARNASSGLLPNEFSFLFWGEMFDFKASYDVNGIQKTCDKGDTGV